MSSLVRNPWEESARARKLAALLDAVDADSTGLGLHPRHDAAAIFEGWKNATGLRFAELVQRAGIKPPSSTTIGEFFEALQHRAQLATRPADRTTNQPRWKVRYYDEIRQGVWSRTFFDEQKAREFAEGKVLYNEPAKVERVGGKS